MNNEVEKINLIHGIYEDYLDMYMNVYAHVNAKLLRTMDKRAEDIVERFARGDKARSSEGNGLGLAIVSTYAGALGGAFDINIDCDQFKATLSFPVEEVQ